MKREINTNQVAVIAIFLAASMECGMIIYNHYPLRLGFDQRVLDVEDGEITAHRSSIHIGFAYSF